jgi:hypothetical protein
MPDKARDRIDAIGKQLSPLPPVSKVAPGSSLPRVKDKVIIITGKHHLRCFLSHSSNPRVNIKAPIRRWVSAVRRLINMRRAVPEHSIYAIMTIRI